MNNALFYLSFTNIKFLFMINKLPKMALMLLALGLSPNATQAGDLSISNSQTEVLGDSVESKKKFEDFIQISPYSTIYPGKSEQDISDEITTKRELRLKNLSSKNEVKDVSLYFNHLNLLFTHTLKVRLNRIFNINGTRVEEELGFYSYEYKTLKNLKNLEFNIPKEGVYTISLQYFNHGPRGIKPNVSKTFGFKVGDADKATLDNYSMTTTKKGKDFKVGDKVTIEIANNHKFWLGYANDRSLLTEFLLNKKFDKQKLEYTFQETGLHRLVSVLESDIKSHDITSYFDVKEKSSEEDSIASVSTVKTVNYYFNYDFKEDPAKAFTVENPEVLSNITLGESIKFVYKNYEKGSRESQMINFHHPEKSKSKLYINKLKDFEVKVDEFGQYRIILTRLEQGIVGGKIEFEVKNPSNDPNNNSNESDSTIVENPLSDLVENIEKLKEDSIKVNVNSDQDSGFTLKSFDTENLKLGDEIHLEVDEIAENSTIAWQVYVNGAFDRSFGHTLNKEGLNYKIEKVGKYEIIKTEINKNESWSKSIKFEIKSEEKVTELEQETTKIKGEIFSFKPYNLQNLKSGDKLNVKIASILDGFTLSWNLFQEGEQVADKYESKPSSNSAFTLADLKEGKYVLSVRAQEEAFFPNVIDKEISFTVAKSNSEETKKTNEDVFTLKDYDLSNLKVNDTLELSVDHLPEDSQIEWSLLLKGEEGSESVDRLLYKTNYNFILEKAGEYTLYVSNSKFENSEKFTTSKKVEFSVQENKVEEELADLPITKKGIPSFSKNMTISPNPSNGQIRLHELANIEFTNSSREKVELLDSQGRVIDSKAINENHEYDFSNHKPGLYNLRVIGDAGIKILRFLIQ